MNQRIHYKRLYSKLGLTKSASIIDLKHRYHQLAAKYHPDKNILEKDQQKKLVLFQDIQSAYQELNKYYAKHERLPYEATESLKHESLPQYKTHHKEDQPSLSSIIWFTFLAILLIIILLFIPAQDNSYFHEDNIPNDALDSNTPLNSRSLTDSNESNTLYANKNKRAILIGMTMGKVFELLGVPDSTVGNNWYYGNSEIYFRDGLVAGWNIDPASSIKSAKGLPLHQTPPPRN